MKPTAILVNTARGPLVDEPALCRALAEKRLAGYGTDVFSHTPPAADDPLFRFENVVATPWVAGVGSPGAKRNMARVSAEVVAKVLSGQEAPAGCILNPEAFAVWRGRKRA
jgi:phosphoglycerate dehydrogenase-like enzyme